MVKVSAFRWVPEAARGLVRDLRVRWALNEAGRPYEEALIGPEDQKSSRYRQWQPFGQVPAYEEPGLALFESGAIVLHIAQSSEALMSPDPAERARTTTWVFASLNTIEPPIMMLNQIRRTPDGQKAEGPILELVRKRLGDLSAWLEGKDFLVERFSVADLLMASVLEILRKSDLLPQYPTLQRYRDRCLSRPAYQKALAAQLAVFDKHSAPAG